MAGRLLVVSVGRVATLRRSQRSEAPVESRTPPRRWLSHVVIAAVPQERYPEVLEHVTPIFLRDEPLSLCFPPCTDGRRSRDFQEYALAQLQSGLSMMAVDMPGKSSGDVVDEDELRTQGTVVGCCLNRTLTWAKVVEDGRRLQDYAEDKEHDPLLRNVQRLLTTVHLQLDLFSSLAVRDLLEIGLVSVRHTHVRRGLAARMVAASLQRGAMSGLAAAKADATGSTSARVCGGAGMTVVHRLAYADYRPRGAAVFSRTGVDNPALTVLAARLQPRPPFVLPVVLEASRRLQ